MSRILQIGVKIAIAVALMVTAGLLAVFVAYRVGLYVAEAPDDEVYALTDARLVDGTGGEPVDEATILVDGTDIAAAGPADDVELPDEARTIGLDGRTVIPGLIDAHVHLAGPQLEDDQDFDDVGLPSMLWENLRQAPTARKGLIEHGVTTVRSTGDPDDWIVGVRESIRDHDIEGPRIFASGPILTAPGGHPVSTIFEGNDYLIETTTRQIEDPDQARDEVAAVDELGVDVVKVVVDSGSDGELPSLDPEVLEAIVEEASRRDLPVYAHWRRTEDLEVALQAGVDGLEHPGYDVIPEDKLEQIVDRNIAFTPTLSVFSDDGPPEAGRTNTAGVAEAGGQVVAGSDVPNVSLRFGPALHRELELLVESGLTNSQALKAATSRAADHLGDDRRIGTVAAGYRADLVVLDGDPLRDISATRTTQMVVRDGKILVDEDGLAR